jgi:hypothetical protein
MKSGNGMKVRADHRPSDTSLTASSCCDIQVFGFGEDLVSEVAAQEARGIEIDSAAKDGRKLILHGEERKAWSVSRLELHEDVHVAVGAEVGTQHRAEQGKAPDMMTPAEVGQLVPRYVNAQLSHGI